MFMKFYTSIFVLFTLGSTLLVVSSSSWVTAWVGLEVNMMSLIPIFLYKMTPTSSEATIKYFLTQAFASLCIILSGLLFTKFSPLPSFIDSSSLVTLALSIKLGMAPTHFWFPQILELINWTQSMIILTWQKIAPFCLIYLTSPLFLTATIVASALVGATGGFNQNSIKKILAYSSITHMSWMAVATWLNPNIWVLYFTIYAAMTILIISPLNKLSISSLKKINSLPSSSITKLLIFVNLFSLAGLPPFIGVIPKIMILTSIFFLNIYLTSLSLLLILSSLTTIFFYLSLSFTSFSLFNQPNFTQSMTYSPFSVNSSLFLTISSAGLLFIGPLVLFV